MRNVEVENKPEAIPASTLSKGRCPLYCILTEIGIPEKSAIRLFSTPSVTESTFRSCESSKPLNAWQELLSSYQRTTCSLTLNTRNKPYFPSQEGVPVENIRMPTRYRQTTRKGNEPAISHRMAEGSLREAETPHIERPLPAERARCATGPGLQKRHASS